MQPTPIAACVLVVVVSAVLVCRGRCSLYPARLMRGSLGSKIGRVLVYSDSDLSTAYGFAKLIQLAPLSSK